MGFRNTERGPIVANLVVPWVPFGSGFQAPGYVVLPDLYCNMVGVAFNAAPVPMQIIAFLPTQLRPAASHNFICSGSGGRQAQVIVDSNGDVVLFNFDPGINWVSFGAAGWPIGA